MAHQIFPPLLYKQSSPPKKRKKKKRGKRGKRKKEKRKKKKEKLFSHIFLKLFTCL
jgi:hypothetical protein